jgi:hypothetical protein
LAQGVRRVEGGSGSTAEGSGAGEREAEAVGIGVEPGEAGTERRWSSAKVIESLADVMVMKGAPEHIRSDNSPEFVAKDLRKWLAAFRMFFGMRRSEIQPYDLSLGVTRAQVKGVRRRSDTP